MKRKNYLFSEQLTNRVKIHVFDAKIAAFAILLRRTMISRLVVRFYQYISSASKPYGFIGLVTFLTNYQFVVNTYARTRYRIEIFTPFDAIKLCTRWSNLFGNARYTI